MASLSGRPFAALMQWMEQSRRLVGAEEHQRLAVSAAFRAEVAARLRAERRKGHIDSVRTVGGCVVGVVSCTEHVGEGGVKCPMKWRYCLRRVAIEGGAEGGMWEESWRTGTEHLATPRMIYGQTFAQRANAEEAVRGGARPLAAARGLVAAGVAAEEIPSRQCLHGARRGHRVAEGLQGTVPTSLATFVEWASQSLRGVGPDAATPLFQWLDFGRSPHAPDGTIVLGNLSFLERTRLVLAAFHDSALTDQYGLVEVGGLGNRCLQLRGAEGSLTPFPPPTEGGTGLGGPVRVSMLWPLSFQTVLGV